MALYESALRGDPFGVMQLLWTTRGRQLTATIGAVITLVPLVLDSFNQAIITIYPCQIPDATSVAGVPRVNTLHIPESQPLTMQYNMLATILGVGSFDVRPSCQSGTCTLDQEYHSVGFCSRCTDISDQLLRNCTIPGNIQPRVRATLPSCRWFIQDDRFFEDAGNPNYIGYDTASTTDGADLWKVVKYEATTSLSHTFSWIADPPQALSCSVKPCVRSYKSAVVNGSFAERLVGKSQVWPDALDPAPYQWDVIYSRMLNRDCLPTSAKQALTRQNIDITPEWIPYNYTVLNYSGEVLKGMAPDPTIPDQCLYQYKSYELAEGLPPLHYVVDWFEAQFLQPLTAWVSYNGTNVTDGISSDFFDGALDSRAPPMFWYNSLELNQSDAMRAVYQNGSLTGDTVAQMFDNITITLTNFARSNPSALLSGNELGLDLTPAQAPELLQDSCIHINWPWLALPAALMVLSMLFLGLTVVQSALPNSIGIWKSSPLALLWHGFEVPQPTSATSDDLKTMEAMSSSMNVHLQQTGLGWKLVQRD
ncbi:hypothetical protein LTR10_021096 [Elasticomyces elasticus]|uniref:Uncharacterized protein n=1 Tax=Exophiala sideris TaxID=1016849 RepID=A0ABR0J6G0_9EURO|nr:hypothetical protein LTR10_021096 [Elasticomyces elasticus]KAK5028893.1 hypothetical protein LTS07_006274 [Exophiala sideris]KAK5035762.1 hypothetical protein LTR13_005893 [Exophiala sideris]KAK5057397.1 hypothetical protein LTR69_007438 [Exophiala sideris]KAK5181627.1 hypothetical protein LTR44_005826 [Eurotiomycetes sp. CCFEE 6388]